MLGGWAPFVSPFTEDDSLLLPSSEFDDDDPSSYLLYPPGFGPIVDWPATPAPGQKAADGVLRGGRSDAAMDGSVSASSGDDLVAEPEKASCGVKAEEGRCSDGSGALELLGLSEALSGNRVKEETSLGSGVGSAESGSDGSSSSASSSSSSSEEDKEDDDDSDEDEDGRDGGEAEKMDGVADLEEGEIRDMRAEKFAMSGDDDEDGGTKGPVRSKNELEVLPPVPPVNVSLEPHHRTLPVGMVSSIIGTQVIVEGVEKHNPLNEGSILWLTETRSPLGLVDEIFGPVKNPYYVVRFNCEEEIPAGIREGTAVSFVMEFADHILDEPALYKKGYDASGDNDEEVYDEVEFSDDEKEAEHKKSQRQAKRGTDNRRQRDQESIGKSRFQFDKRRFQTNNTGFGKRKDVQPWAPSASAPIRQPSNITSQPPSTLQRTLPPSALAPCSQPPNVPSQFQSTPRPPFNPGQAHAPSLPTCVPGQVRSLAHPLFVPDQVPAQLPCAPGQVQAPPQPPLGQLQVLQASLPQPYTPGQLQAPTQPYIPGPFQASTLPASVPGLQAPSITSNVGCGDLTSVVAGISCLPAILYGGQPGGPFGGTQQNLLMPQPNTVWATQQFIAGLSSMLQSNAMPCQQQGHHPFLQNLSQPFPSFTNGMPFQHQLIPNQGIPPTMMPWQGGMPNPSIGPSTLEPMGQDSLGQAPSGHGSTGVQGAFGSSNGNHNGGQFEAAMAQGDMHTPMKFSMGNSSARGGKPHGRRGGRTRS